MFLIYFEGENLNNIRNFAAVKWKNFVSVKQNSKIYIYVFFQRITPIYIGFKNIYLPSLGPNKLYSMDFFK